MPRVEIELESGVAGHTSFGPITRTLFARRCDAVRAQTYVGHAFAVVGTHTPTGIAT